MRVLICDGLHKQGVNIFEAAQGIQVELHDRLEADNLLKRIKDFEGVVIRSRTNITKEVIDRAPRLRVIGRAGIGVENIDIESATQRGILVMNTPGANAMAAAEHTLALMLALSRHIPQADQSMRAKKWEKRKFIGILLKCMSAMFT